jgi:hypothetical protein
LPSQAPDLRIQPVPKNYNWIFTPWPDFGVHFSHPDPTSRLAENPMIQVSMKSNHLLALAAILPFLTTALSAAVVVNVDFSRDISGQNPGTNPADVVYSSTGPAPDTGTVWNDFSISLPATGDDGTQSIAHPVTFSNLSASDGSATAIDVTLTSGFYRSFNSTAAASSNDQDALQNERVFSRNSNTGIITISGLDSSLTYDLYFIASSFNTTFNVGAATASALGTINTVDGTLVWTAGGHYASLAGISPNISGEIAIGVTGNGQANGAIAGMQVVAIPEPSSMLLVLGSALCLTTRRRR